MINDAILVAFFTMLTSLGVAFLPIIRDWPNQVQARREAILRQRNAEANSADRMRLFFWEMNSIANRAIALNDRLLLLCSDALEDVEKGEAIRKEYNQLVEKFQTGLQPGSKG